MRRQQHWIWLWSFYAGKISIYGKIREFVFLFVFIIFCFYTNIHRSKVTWFSHVVTRSSGKSESMSDISEEIRKNFPKLIKPLSTNTSLKEMFDKMKVISKVISKLESKINEQKDKFMS